MCDKCVEIDQAIERHRQIQRTILDQVTIDRTREVLAELLRLKSALHPKEER
jgi:hypothetical protein